MTAAPTLPARLRTLVGHRHVLTGAAATRPYTTGYRFGRGSALAVVRPGNLVELWRVLQVCVEAGCIVILQSANTGLTGGSTPHGDYDTEAVLISTMRITGIHLLDGGRQVVCLPGATLNALEGALRPLGREPHSVIGSSCIGASVLGGICNSSGGALLQRGPAYTELALFARLTAAGRLELVNHLGIAITGDVEAVLRRVEQGDFAPADIAQDGGRASDHAYADHVRKIDEATPARFNADPGRLFEASGSAGKVALLAVRLDTFAKEPESATFYIGTNDTADLATIRRDVLGGFATLPVSGEYIHRDAFAIAARYGKDTVLAIERLGTDRLPSLYAAKARVDRWAGRLPLLPAQLSDHALQAAGRLFPDHLPRRMRDWHARYEHHLILKMSGPGIAEARDYLARRYPNDAGDVFECSPAEAVKAFLHRFAVAGAAVRYRTLNTRTVSDIVALDIALRRNDANWFERLPEELESLVVHKLYYGHFFCHVFHQDYILKAGVDPYMFEHRMLALLDARGAEYPAEHNVGHLYAARPALAEHYRALDPCNRFNPGIGKTSKRAHWA